MFHKISLLLAIFLSSSFTLLAMEDDGLEKTYQKACILYDTGNKTEAYNTYLEAAEQGHAKSLNSLGSINESIGELKMALEFYDLSNKQGYNLAKENYDRLLSSFIPKNMDLFNSPNFGDVSPAKKQTSISQISTAEKDPFEGIEINPKTKSQVMELYNTEVNKLYAGIVQNSLKEGDSVEKIARCTGLTVEQVQEIKNQNIHS